MHFAINCGAHVVTDNLFPYEYDETFGQETTFNSFLHLDGPVEERTLVLVPPSSFLHSLGVGWILVFSALLLAQ